MIRQDGNDDVSLLQTSTKWPVMKVYMVLASCHSEEPVFVWNGGALDVL